MTLEEFAQDCRTILQSFDEYQALLRLLARLHSVLPDTEFLQECFGKADWIARRVIYEDAETGFCTCAHINHDRIEGKPHDHGPTWAIYGQAAGETQMDEWELVAPAVNGCMAKVKKVRSYRLVRGDVHLYKPGVIHSPLRANPARLIRIEGKNLDAITRQTYEPV